MEYTITLPDSFTFTRAGHELTVKLDFSPAVLAQAVLHGLTQTIGDAASAAASGAYETSRKPDDGKADWKALTAQERKDWTTANGMNVSAYGLVLMEKRINALRESGWEARRDPAAGLDEFQEACARLVMARMSFDKGVKTADRIKAGWAKYESLDAETQDKVAGLARAAVERARAEREALAGLDF
jgi:hypothetical protein